MAEPFSHRPHQWPSLGQYLKATAAPSIDTKNNIGKLGALDGTALGEALPLDAQSVLRNWACVVGGETMLMLIGVAAVLPLSVASAPDVGELSRLSIEELAQVEVTSVSRRPEELRSAPAAVYVISNEDIRRSGVLNLADALRLAPNIQVQQIDARTWAVSARGSNGYETSNKLLVLIDGRSVYTPLHAGVFWEMHELPLEDIERIEVISGPGGTLYGPNAVNGVVNVITKIAQDTKGGLVTAAYGNQQKEATIRYGGGIGEAGAYRVYLTGFDRDDLVTTTGADPNDGSSGFQAGFRTDFGSADSAFTLQGDVLDTSHDIRAQDGDTAHNILGRWNRRLSDSSAFQVQAYYDRFERRFLGVLDALTTYDLQAQHNWSSGPHDVVWGAGVRVTHDEFINRLNPFVLDPERRWLTVANVFAQDKFALRPDLALTLGVKLEKTSFTGTEVLPNARLAWQPSTDTLVWSAVSRAVRTPSRIDRQLVAPGILAPNDDFVSEKLTAFEAGYRAQPFTGTTLSISVFYNVYDDLRTTALSPAGGLPVRLENGLRGETYGVEAWGSYQLTGWWRLHAGVATLHKDFEVKPGRTDITNGASAGNDPDYSFKLRSQMEVTDNVNIDVTTRTVDDLEHQGIDGFTAVDARIAWRLTPGVEFAVSGFNLFDKRHAESFYQPPVKLVRRSVVASTRVVF